LLIIESLLLVEELGGNLPVLPLLLLELGRKFLDLLLQSTLTGRETGTFLLILPLKLLLEL